MRVINQTIDEILHVHASIQNHLRGFLSIDRVNRLKLGIAENGG